MAYLDHAATTPMLPEAVEAMTAQLSVTGNASALHAAGRRARRTVEEARETLAEALGARPSEVVFTSGGTEADNLAVKGLYWARRDADPARTRVLASPVEHHAVLDAVDWLAEHEGATVEYLPVDSYGRVHPEALREAVGRNPDDVALATVMWANNEIGTVMPVAELAAVAKEFDVPMHADAVQAFGQLDVDFAASGLAAMTVSGHKIGGPYGIGALLLGREYSPVPVLHGGGQERHVRSGTLDAPAIAAFAVAGRLATERREDFARDVGSLRDDLVRAVRAAVPRRRPRR
ncbi:cysteine desulfurase [Streptomyces pristinaespiralis]